MRETKTAKNSRMWKLPERCMSRALPSRMEARTIFLHMICSSCYVCDDRMNKKIGNGLWASGNCLRWKYNARQRTWGSRELCTHLMFLFLSKYWLRSIACMLLHFVYRIVNGRANISFTNDVFPRSKSCLTWLPGKALQSPYKSLRVRPSHIFIAQFNICKHFLLCNVASHKLNFSLSFEGLLDIILLSRRQSCRFPIA